MSRIVISVKGVKASTDKLNAYKRSLTDFFGAAIKDATEEAARTADDLYHNAEHETHSVIVKPDAVMKSEGAVEGGVTANGKAVVFLEFGAGNTTAYGEHGEQIANFETATGVSVAPGSYSSSADGSGSYANYGYWYFGGERYYGVYPRRGMYHAMQTLSVDLANARSDPYQNNISILKV